MTDLEVRLISRSQHYRVVVEKKRFSSGKVDKFTNSVARGQYRFMHQTVDVVGSCDLVKGRLSCQSHYILLLNEQKQAMLTWVVSRQISFAVFT